MREIGKDFQDVVGLRLCDKIVNFAQNASNLLRLDASLSCDKSLSDLDDCHEIV